MNRKGYNQLLNKMNKYQRYAFNHICARPEQAAEPEYHWIYKDVSIVLTLNKFKSGYWWQCSVATDPVKLVKSLTKFEKRWLESMAMRTLKGVGRISSNTDWEPPITVQVWKRTSSAEKDAIVTRDSKQERMKYENRPDRKPDSEADANDGTDIQVPDRGVGIVTLDGSQV